jgi:hypothetical protein
MAALRSGARLSSPETEMALTVCSLKCKAADAAAPAARITAAVQMPAHRPRRLRSRRRTRAADFLSKYLLTTPLSS